MSVITDMVDRACGFDRAAYKRERAAINGHDADGDWLVLFCPECGRFVASERQPQIDPAATPETTSTASP